MSIHGLINLGGNTLRGKLHEPCACGIQIGGAKERQHPHNDINYKKRVIRVLRHAVSPAGDPNPHARLGAGRYPNSTSSGTKSGSSSVKIKNGVSTNVLSKSNHIHGGGYNRIICIGKSRIRLRFNLQKKMIFYAGVYFTENLLEISFCSNTEFRF